MRGVLNDSRKSSSSSAGFRRMPSPGVFAIRFMRKPSSGCRRITRQFGWKLDVGWLKIECGICLKRTTISARLSAMRLPVRR
ncbi:hypothetical protein D3C81_370960 [compost metagenome]